MSRVYPYRTAPVDSVRASSWTRIVADGAVPLSDALSDWDYNTPLDLARAVEVDAKCIRARVGLSSDAPLSLSVRWTASGSFLRGSAFRTTLPDADEVMVPVRCLLPGADLGGVVTLETCVSVGRRVDGSVPPRTPTRGGSIVWRDAYEVRLQGGAPLFPIATADFTDLPHPTDAAWYLEVTPEFDAAAMGAILLLVNVRCEELMRALASASAPDAAGRAVLAALRTGVAGSLIEHALISDDFPHLEGYERGSLGEAVAGLVRQLGLDDVESLRREREREPALFSARLQHATRLWSAR